MTSQSYLAATEHAAVFEADWSGVARLTGADRIAWLQGMVTADVEKLAPGQGCYAAHLNAQGKLLAQMTILLEADSVCLTLERSAIGHLLQTFDKLIVMEDVVAEDFSAELAVVGVVGPGARAVLERFLSGELNLDGLYRHRHVDDGRVFRGLLGYELLVPRAGLDGVLRRIAECGAAAIEHGVWDVLRTEAGLPVYGVDVDATTTMPELGERGISYDKGCYIGQEVVARVKYIGHVNRCFSGFLVDGSVAPAAGSIVRAAGKDVGHVTTGLFSPALGRAIALGFVNRQAAAPGTAVELSGANGTVPAAVTALPFIPSRLAV